MQYQYIFAQIFGFAAMAVAISMYQFKKHRSIMLLMIFCSSLWCMHYLALGLFTPVAMNLINVARNILYSFREKKWGQSNFIPAAFLLISFLSLVLTWEGLLSLFPFAASIAATLANWQTDTRRLKILTVPVCICWFIYNFVNHSYAGMANEIFTFISIVIALVRYKKSSAAEMSAKQN